MSYNLIYHGEFTQPILTTDSFLYSSAFSTDQQNNFYWSCGPYTAIQNGNTIFGCPDPIFINETQFCSIQYTIFFNNNLH